MVRRYVWLARDDIEPRAPDPALAQRRRQCIRVDERPAARVHEHGGRLHAAQEARVDEALRCRAARREHEHDVARRRERIGVDALDGLQVVLRGEGGIARCRWRG